MTGVIGVAGAETVGRRVFKRRQDRGWDQSELARRSGVSGSYISRLEANVYERPSVERLGALADALGCRVVDLIDPPPESEDSAGALAERLYAAGVSRDRAPLVEKLVLDLARRTPRQQDQLIEMWAGMLDLAAP